MRYQHSGNAKVTTLAAPMTPTDLTFTVADGTGHPDGSLGPFWESVDKGAASEEKILCSGRSGNVFQVWTGTGANGRGMDGTVAQDHGLNAVVEHIWTATEADQANAHLNEGSGAHGYPAIADLVTLTGAQVIKDKTLVTPNLAAPAVADMVALGGTFNEADKISLIGPQAEAEFRVRNTYIGTGVPDNALGNDGDLFISKA